MPQNKYNASSTLAAERRKGAEHLLQRPSQGLLGQRSLKTAGRRSPDLVDVPVHVFEDDRRALPVRAVKK
ncbi:MAG: hypothetical protein AB1714_03545 [Acidobacteriota bacterium]